MTHVPYRGGGPAMNDVMGGHVPVFFANIASGLGNITGGKLRALAVAHDKRIPALANIPTLAEVGVTGGLVYEWNGLFVPAGTPDVVVDRLAQALDAALQSPEVRQRIEGLGGDIVGGGPQAAQSFIVDQRRTVGDLIREQGIKID
jgi:tripartite-type tricarboxylate transporter receptor subunit TctC